VIGILSVEDEIRPESAHAVKALHELGLRVAMITRDSQAVAVSVKLHHSKQVRTRKAT
jgi:Cu2+-exporting ATPase